MSKASFRPSRRAFLGGVGAAVAVPSFLRWEKVAAQSRPLVFTTWGGNYQEAQERAFVRPFEAATGIKVIVASGADMGKLRAQVKSGNIEWDVVDSTGPMITAGERDGLWEPLDKNIIDTSGLVPGAARTSGVGFARFSGGIGYDPARDPDGKHPRTFAEFWDVEKFPGRRGLRTRVSETLEMALLADGVEPSKLYPLDVERGFAALDRIKPHVTNWIAQTPQTITLIQSNEVDFTYAYSGRVLAAQRAGVSIAFSYDQTINPTEYFAVPKGTQQKDAAMRFIDFTLRPDRQAEFAEIMAYTPTKIAALDLLDAETKKKLPDLSNPNSVIFNDDWWADHLIELEKRFKEWML